MKSDIESDIRKGIAWLKKNDPKLAAIIKEVGPLNYRTRLTGFEALAQIITGQQLSGKAAATIFGRFRRALPNARVTAKGVGAVDDDTLRGCGLSAAKTRALRDLTTKIEAGEVSPRSFHRMTDEDIAAMITSVKGLGPWSAQMYLMFVLRRLDVFAAGDLGIQTAMQRQYGLEKASDDLESFAERWRPYRTIACWYLWASLRNRPLEK